MAVRAKFTLNGLSTTFALATPVLELSEFKVLYNAQISPVPDTGDNILATGNWTITGVGTPGGVVVNYPDVPDTGTLILLLEPTTTRVTGPYTFANPPTPEALNTEFVNVYTNIDSANGDIAVLEANDIVQDADIDALEANDIIQDADIDALEAYDIVQDGNIATNTSNIGTNTGNIATNTGNIATNTGDIATNTANIATNTGNIATNAGNIATNAGDITAVENRTTALETEVDTEVLKLSVPADGKWDAESRVIKDVGSPVSANDAARLTDVQATAATGLPSVAGNAGKALVTDGVVVAWTYSDKTLTNETNIGTNTTNIGTNTTDIGTNATAITGKVAKTGDTMTGDLTVQGAALTKVTVDSSGDASGEVVVKSNSVTNGYRNQRVAFFDNNAAADVSELKHTQTEVELVNYATTNNDRLQISDTGGEDALKYGSDIISSKVIFHEGNTSTLLAAPSIGSLAGQNSVATGDIDNDAVRENHIKSRFVDMVVVDGDFTDRVATFGTLPSPEARVYYTAGVQGWTAGVSAERAAYVVPQFVEESLTVGRPRDLRVVDLDGPSANPRAAFGVGESVTIRCYYIAN